MTTEQKWLPLLGFAWLASAMGCGDQCHDGYVDTSGMCTGDGYEYQRAHAIASVLGGLSNKANGTRACGGGGTVTTTWANCGYGPAICDNYGFTFVDCASSSLLISSGQLSDRSTMAVDNSGIMNFGDAVSGTIVFRGTVTLKSDNKQFPTESCVMNFTDSSKLTPGANGVDLITGTMCGQNIDQPLYTL